MVIIPSANTEELGIIIAWQYPVKLQDTFWRWSSNTSFDEI